MNIIMAVTGDAFELPLAITDTVGEMAKLYGVTPSSICHHLRLNENRTRRRESKYTFVRVRIEEDPHDRTESHRAS